MLTINENAQVKGSNLKTVLTVLSSVAVIGAASTYIASSGNQSKRTSELSSFMSDDMHGDFDFEFNGSSYLTNGRFSKTIDQNGEWEVEYLLEGEDSSFALKDGAYMRKYENSTSFECQQNIDNIGYGKYKYDLLKAVKVDKSQLTKDSQNQITKSCNSEDDIYVLENEDFGNLIICPSNNVNGFRAGIIAEGFSGIVKAKEGLRELKLSEDFKFDNDGVACREHSKFVSVVDTLNESITAEDKELNTMTPADDNSSTFPFIQRKLWGDAYDMEDDYDDRDGERGGAPSVHARSWPNKNTEVYGPGSRPSFGVGGSKRNSLDCQVVHGAGNNKGYSKKTSGQWSGNNGRWTYTKWWSHGNQHGGYNSKSYQPCWVFNSVLGNTVVSYKRAYLANSGKLNAAYAKKHSLFYTVDNPSYAVGLSYTGNEKIVGYNFYWGDNMMKNNINGLPMSDSLLSDKCNWTTFGDFNSNQLSYKTPLIMREISNQICGYKVGEGGCVFGTQWGFKQLVLSHSMGTMLVMQVVQNGLIKKGPRGTIAMSGAPLRGSIGANGVDHYCGQTTSGIGFLGAFWNKIVKGNLHFWSPSSLPYALSQGASCGANKNLGGIEVIKQLVLMYVVGQGVTYNTAPNMGPSYFNVNNTGTYPHTGQSGFVDHKLCGLHPTGGVSKKTMMRLTNTACQDGDFCLEMRCNQTAVRCHFRGCASSGCSSSDKSSYRNGAWTYQHDNHVSKHSCMANNVYKSFFGSYTVQKGQVVKLVQSNHKHMCCKYGDGALSHVKPCLWYRMVARHAAAK